MRIVYVTYADTTMSISIIANQFIKLFRTFTSHEILNVSVGDAKKYKFLKEHNIDCFILHMIPNDCYRKIILNIRKNIKNPLIIGYLVWETTKLPLHLIKNVLGTNRFILPSQFNYDVFLKYFLKDNLKLIHHPINYNLFKMSNRRKNINNPYIFYAINNYDAIRKNIKNILITFGKTFTSYDNCIFYLKTNKKLKKKKELNNIIKWIKSLKNAPKIIIDTNFYSNYDIGKLHIMGDCFVSMSHGEGVGLGAVEASMFGNIVMTPKWGGAAEYIKYGYFIDYTVGNIHEESYYYKKDHQWCFPSNKSLAKGMRDILKNRNKYKEIGEMNKKYVNETFKVERVIKDYDDFLLSLKEDKSDKDLIL